MKFDNEITEKLYELSLDGMVDEELGDVQDFGWYGLMKDTGVPDASYAILHEDSQGFVYSYTYPSLEEVIIVWTKLEEEERLFYERKE